MSKVSLNVVTKNIKFMSICFYYNLHNKFSITFLPGHALDVFDNYPQLLMEMALRLPCQIHKHCDPANFDTRWRTLLCEYMMNPQTPLRYLSHKLCVRIYLIVQVVKNKMILYC